MRIISGRFKGHPLVSFKADHIRPTTDRVKETLFNKLMFDLEDAMVVDLFCGTGNLGLEALSRGAKHVVFVEKNPKSMQITKQNIEKLKVGKDEYTLVQMDVLDYLKRYKGDGFDIVLVDPPFTEKMAHTVMEAADLSTIWKDNTVLTIESQGKERMDEEYSQIIRFDVREYGDKILSFFKKKT